jgi:predicted pyridoxine 5'-phosphate oxidase superfamily flavin-nucleotide-binding protein
MVEPSEQRVTEFSEPGSAAVPWGEAERVLRESEMFWLSTVRRDGRPHVTPLPAKWLDGRLHRVREPVPERVRGPSRRSADSFRH